MGSRRETIILALAAVILLAGIYLLAVGRRGSAPAPVAPAAATSEERPVGPVSAAATEAEGELAEEASQGTAQARNPFTSPVGASAAATASAEPSESQEATAGPVSTPPAFGEGVIGPAPVTPAASPPKLTLTGILSGKKPLAVLRYGEERFLVREGEAIHSPSEYVVKSIRSGQVLLVGKEGKLVLNLQGGR